MIGRRLSHYDVVEDISRGERPLVKEQQENGKKGGDWRIDRRPAHASQR
jgi:hypothetical protein